MILDEMLMKTIEPNEVILKKRRKKVDEIMDVSEERLNFK